MIMETKSNLKSSMMAGNQSAIYQVESFLEEVSPLPQKCFERKDRVLLHQT